MSKDQTPNSDAEQRHDARPDEAGKQEALRASELRYRRLFESAQDGILILDADTGMIVDVNPLMINLLGYSREFFLTKKVWELGFLGDAIANEDMFRELQAKGYVRYEDLPLETSEGRRIEVEFVSNAYLVNEQQVIQCNIRDITERKKAEKAGRERVELLQSISQIMIKQDNVKSLCQKIADAMSNAWYYPEIACARIIYEGKSYQTEDFSKTKWCLSADLRIKDKSVGTVEVCYLEERPPRDEGPFLKEEWNVINIIAERLGSVIERKLDEEQIRFQAALIENSPMMAAYHDKDLNTIWVNKAYEEATGLSLKDVRGKKCYQVWNLSKPCRGCPVITAIETGETAPAELTPDNQDHWPESQGYWLSHAAPFRDEQGTIIGAIEFAIDITERKQAEKAQEKLQAQLNQAQKMESVGRLAGGVAHDFNNMLGIILGHADMILEEMDPDQPFHADLTEIKKAGERSADLTRQLLAFARKQTVAPEVIDLNKTVEGMLKMLHRLIGEDIDLTWIPGEAVWPVKIDPAQIDQILANLCVNVRDAIADVGKVTIETDNKVFDEDYCREHAGFVPGEYTLLAVSDNGYGMDTETLENIFEPFFTTKESNQGTGLGLATVYGAVKQNNGFINVYSEPGKGTTFKIYLPRHAGQAAETKESRPQAAERGSETILLVEDEPAILKMTTRMLEKSGYKVIAAGTPGEAIALAREHTGEIHLLMTDVVMPEMNGRDLAKNLLSLYPGLKRLFMSGYTANVIAHHGVLDEGVHFIQKPFSKGDLTVKVREALET